MLSEEVTVGILKLPPLGRKNRQKISQGIRKVYSTRGSRWQRETGKRVSSKNRSCYPGSMLSEEVTVGILKLPPLGRKNRRKISQGIRKVYSTRGSRWQRETDKRVSSKNRSCYPGSMLSEEVTRGILKLFPLGHKNRRKISQGIRKVYSTRGSRWQRKLASASEAGKIFFVIREACKRESRCNLLDHLLAFLHS